ncbi:hypothetical protein C0Q70_19359 [Pomacea canaliculata]|uniref:28S ribosomal protein S17, mitochondrial n=1 Tax=Pomacea canaliculata TaxID=400727 RepID=A0A2T7NJ37_POMCA|nr:28S ribosomal protein S17, mitochondrial-like [Pomacea canaliculata]PVD21191.1 hypothetical protein C0Q70_19359 [Pomacea canaliculata]
MASWGSIVIGQVVKRGVVRTDTVKVRCLRLKLDTYLNKYFNSRKHYWAIEKEDKCEIGDIILIERLPKKLTPLVSHEIKHHVFKLGSVVDPVTGKRCRATEFIDEAARELEVQQIEETAKQAS